MKNAKKILLSITIILCFTAGIPFNADTAVNMSDYTAVPPFVSDVVEPNVLILQSNGASMLNPAYCSSGKLRYYGKVEGDNFKPRGVFCDDDMPLIHRGLSRAASNTTIQLAADAPSTIDYSSGTVYVYITSGNCAGYYEIITGYNSSTKTATVTGWRKGAVTCGSSPTQNSYYMVYDQRAMGKAYDRSTDYYGFFKADAPNDGDATSDTRYMTTDGSGNYKATIGASDGKYFRIDGADGGGTHADSLTWSGSFLNWVSMRRIEVARKALVGGRGKCEGKKCERVQVPLGEKPTSSNPGPSFLVGLASDFPKTLADYRTETGDSNAVWFHEVEKTSRTKTEDSGYRIVRYVDEENVSLYESPYTTLELHPYTTAYGNCFGVKDAKLYVRTATNWDDTAYTDILPPIISCRVSKEINQKCYNEDGTYDEPCKAGKLYDADRDGVASEYVTEEGGNGTDWTFSGDSDVDCDDTKEDEECGVAEKADKHKLRIWVDRVDPEDLGVVQKMADKVRFGLTFFRKDETIPAKNDGAMVIVPADFYNSTVTIFNKDSKAYFVPHLTALIHEIMGLKLIDDPDIGEAKIIEDKDGKPKSWSPLAEGLWTATGYFMQTSENMPAKCDSTGTDTEPCGPHYYDVSRKPSQQYSYYWAYQYGKYTGNWENNNGKPQIDPVTGTYYYNYDPYYFTRDYSGDGKLQTSERDIPAPCCKSFVLVVTDARSSYDLNVPSTQRTALDGNADAAACPPYPYSDTSKTLALRQASCGSGFIDDVAYWAHINDLRPDLTGNQYLTTYILYAFGAGDQLAKDASRYGGFIDANGNKLPDLASEWYADGNGVPDTYFEAQTAQELPNKLLDAIMSILTQSASGTSVSVLSTSAEGEGALYQAYFYPRKIKPDFTERYWLGYVRGLFLDTYGNMREDTDSNGRLVLSQDRIVQMSFDSTTFEVKAKLFDDSDEDGKPDTAEPISTTVLDNIKPLWEGGKVLAKRSSLRNIYTWLPSGSGGTSGGGFSSGNGTPKDFSTSEAAALRRHLRASTDTESSNIISYVRGNAVSGYRKRDVDVDGTDLTWKLGDIVYSTPTVVASPKEQYDLIYGESSYVAFRSAYKDRRHIIYVGANDGMLHAFNAGVYKAGDDGDTSATEHGRFIANPTSGDGWGAALGDELWAFTPYEALPHLAWLTCDGSGTNPGACNGAKYGHTYYVDLKPKITDVTIFNDAATSVSGLIDGQGSVSHPNGWGTILIIGMRLGGGAMGVDLSSPSDNDFADTGEKFRSAYYVFDITDPEKKPKLLWRFTDANMGFATAFPAIAHIKTTSAEKWFLVVGSGPTNADPSSGTPPQPGTMSYTGTGTQQGRIYVFDLVLGTNPMTFTRLGVNNDATKPWLNSTATAACPAAGCGYGFMGDPIVVDGDLNYTTDVIYIGSAYSTTSASTATKGKLYRIKIKGSTDPTQWDLSLMFDQDKPLLVGPSASKDTKENNLWVFFGTGRLWTKNDKQDSSQQTIFGIKDGCWTSDSTCRDTYDKSTQLVDVTDAVVTTDQTVSGIAGTTCYYGGGSCLYEKVQGKKGWYMNLTASKERILSKSVVLGGMVLVTSFVPNTDVCSFQGDSYLYALYYETGAAYIKPVIGYDETSKTIYKSTSLGKGMPTTVGIAIGKTTKGYVQTSTGAIIEIEAQPGLGIRSGPTGWREKTGSGGTIGIEEIYKHIVK